MENQFIIITKKNCVFNNELTMRIRVDNDDDNGMLLNLRKCGIIFFERK